MGALWLLAAFGGGLAIGLALTPDRLRLAPRTARESRRLRQLAARVEKDRWGHDREARLGLAEVFLQRADPRGAGPILAPLLGRHPEDPDVRRVARWGLRGLLLQEVREGGGPSAGLMPQDIDWHPGTRRVLLRLKDLTLGGLVELKQLDVYVENFEPGARLQPLPRVVHCRAVIREERLAFLLESRIDWNRTQLRDLRILFRDDQVEITGSVKVKGLPVAFRAEAAAQILGPSKVRLAFPQAPRVAGVVPVPIDTVLKALVRKVEEKLPGALTSVEEATLDLELLRAGVPPVELNLHEIRIREGRIEVRCEADVGAVEGVEVLRLPAPESDQLRPEDDGPRGEDEAAGAEAAEVVAGPSAEAGGVFEALKGFFQGAAPTRLGAALEEAAALRENGDLGQACGVLEAVAAEADPADDEGARVLEAQAALWLQIGGRTQRGRAAEALNKVLEARPDRAGASVSLGRVLAADGDLEGAELRLRLGVQLAPFVADGYPDLAAALEARGATRAAGRAREIAALLTRGDDPREALPAPPTPRSTLFDAGFRRLMHPDESGPTGALLEMILGGLRWFGPVDAPRATDPETHPLSGGGHPRTVRMLETLSRALQTPEPVILVRPGTARSDLEIWGGLDPWIGAWPETFDGWDEGRIAFQLARSLALIRSGRGPFVRLGEADLDLLYALLRAIAGEAKREDRRAEPGGDAVSRAVEGITETVATGWVVRSEDLDAYLARDVRFGARLEALAYHEKGPSFRDLQLWQWAADASADRTGLLAAGSVRAAVRGLAGALPGDPEADGPRGPRDLAALAPHAESRRGAYRLRELLRFAVDPALEDLERDLYS